MDPHPIDRGRGAAGEALSPRLAALMAALPGHVVLLTDDTGIVRHAGGGTEALLDHSPDQLVGRSVSSVVPHEGARRGVVSRAEVSLIGAGGRLVPALLSAVPVVAADGEPEGRVVVLADVSDLSRARRALAGTQLRLRALFDRGIGGIAMFDPEGRFLRVNPVLCGLLGYERAELLERSILDVVADEHRPQVEVYFEAVRRGLPTSTHEEVCYRRRDGSDVWVRVSAHPINDPFTNQRLVVMEMRDVTAARRRRRALLSIAQGLRQPVDGDVISWIVSTAAATLEAACVFVHALRRGPGPAGLLAAQGDLRWIGAGDTPAADTPCDAVSAGALTYLPTPDAAEGRYRELMERSGVMSYIGVPVLTSDGVVGHLGVMDVRPMPAELPVELWSILRTFGERVGAEIERLRFRGRFDRSEEQFRALLEAAAEIFVVTDGGGRVVEVTTSSIAKLGWSPDELRDRPLADFDIDGRFADLWADLVPGEPRVTETRLLARDGRPVPVEATVCLLEWGGELVCLLLARDISERYRLEEARRRFVEDVVAAQEEERARVARELHDSLGQVLTSLSLKLRTVVETSSDPVVRASLQGVLELSATAIGEVSSLAHRLRPPALDDLGFVAAIREHAMAVTADTSLQVDLHVRGQSEDARLTPAVETALYRITQEALTNVLRHSHAQRVGILIDRRPTAVRLVVEDDGCGMGKAPARPSGAAGLGLAGIRERVALLGGEVRIESSPSTGTALYVTVPLVEDGPRRAVPGVERR